MTYFHWTEIRKPAHDCVRVQPCEFGSDRCKPNTVGSHGIGSVQMVWYTSNPQVPGVVQFLLFTGWHLDETPETINGHPTARPMAADLGYHWPTPHYESQGQTDCDLLPLGFCYYDGSGLQAEEPWRILRYEGDAALKKFMEEYHAQVADWAKETPQQ